MPCRKVNLSVSDLVASYRVFLSSNLTALPSLSHDLHSIRLPQVCVVASGDAGGSPSLAKRLMRAAYEAGADAVAFRLPEEEPVRRLSPFKWLSR